MSPRYRCEARTVLNKSGCHGSASVFVRVNPDGSGSVVIADCHKLDLLLRTLSEFRAALVAALEEGA